MKLIPKFICTGYKLATSSALNAEICPPSKKNEVLEFGWDGTTALGGAEVDSYKYLVSNN